MPEVTLKLPHPNSRIYRPKPAKTRNNGNNIRKAKPELYNRTVDMLASPDYSFQDIMDDTGLSWHTVRGIYEAQRQTIDQKRAILAQKTARTLRRLVEHVEDLVPDMSARDSIFGVSVLHDKWALLTGSATSHALNINVNATPVDIAAKFAALHAQIDNKVDDPKTNLNVTKTQPTFRATEAPHPTQDADTEPEPGSKGSGASST
jgi:hypothetical protein